MLSEKADKGYKLKQSKELKKSKKAGIENLPYEKFESLGPEALTESELLAIILRSGVKNHPVMEIAENVLALSESYRPGLLGIYDVPMKKLKSVAGIGDVQAVKIKCISELAMRIHNTSARSGLIIKKPETVANYFMEKLRHRRTECVILVCLDAKGQIIEEIFLSSGSVNMSLISPREVFLAALKSEAVNILLVHNHPSGDPNPSRADIEITADVKAMGEVLNVPLLDHIIIGDNCYMSFKEKGYI